MVRARKHLPFVSLPNILVNDWLVPEILQEDASPENLARALANLLNDSKARQAIEAQFLELHGSLVTDTPQAICDALAPWLD
jgi:lipid-A-disaccharide synthase